MRAYKFLGDGGRGRFSGFRWPRPAGGAAGAWVEAAPAVCATGIHACALEDVPYWLDAELYGIELAGPVERASCKLVAERGRLTHRIEAWDGDAMAAFAAACRMRIEARAETSPELAAYAGDAPDARPATAGFVAARVAELAAGPAAYAAERAWQSRWLADRLSL